MWKLLQYKIDCTALSFQLIMNLSYILRHWQWHFKMWIFYGVMDNRYWLTLSSKTTYTDTQLSLHFIYSLFTIWNTLNSAMKCHCNIYITSVFLMPSYLLRLNFTQRRFNAFASVLQSYIFPSSFHFFSKWFPSESFPTLE